MPACANSTDKVVFYFKNSDKFNTRCSSREFQEATRLDDGDICPVPCALQKWSPAVAEEVTEVVKATVS